MLTRAQWCLLLLWLIPSTVTCENGQGLSGLGGRTAATAPAATSSNPCRDLHSSLDITNNVMNNDFQDIRYDISTCNLIFRLDLGTDHRICLWLASCSDMSPSGNFNCQQACSPLSGAQGTGGCPSNFHTFNHNGTQACGCTSIAQTDGQIPHQSLSFSGTQTIMLSRPTCSKSAGPAADGSYPDLLDPAFLLQTTGPAPGPGSDATDDAPQRAPPSLPAGGPSGTRLGGGDAPAPLPSNATKITASPAAAPPSPGNITGIIDTLPPSSPDNINGNNNDNNTTNGGVNSGSGSNVPTVTSSSNNAGVIAAAVVVPVAVVGAAAAAAAYMIAMRQRRTQKLAFKTNYKPSFV